MEALGLGIVVRIAAPTHRALEAVLIELGAVVLGSILRAAIGMMDAADGRLSIGDGRFEGGERQASIDTPADGIANHATRPGVEVMRLLERARDRAT